MEFSFIRGKNTLANTNQEKKKLIYTELDTASTCYFRDIGELAISRCVKDFEVIRKTPCVQRNF
eukprot:snap_masked-scaffold_3-processed-gene-3.12-mRNA-1 protein AED:0.76 eAED:1.00 QI:0/0/0/1/1/1/2/0/63